MSAGFSQVLLVRPDELRRAARLLRGVGDEMESLAQDALRGTGLDDVWRGLAALEQQARTEAVRQLVVLSARPGLTVARAVDRAADIAESAGARVRAWTRRVDECRAELTSLRATGPPPEPLLEAAWRRRMQEVEQELARAHCLVEEAEREWRAVEQDVAAVVSGAWSVVTELNDLRRVVQPVVQAGHKVWATVQAAGMSTVTAVALARARWHRSTPMRQAAWRRARGWFRRLISLRPGPVGSWSTLGKARFVPGPVGWALSYLGAVQDVRTGGGYAGWRGDTTRVLAAGALVGGPMMVAGVALPPVGIAGIGAVSAYQAWTAGNLAWDHRSQLTRYARQAGRALGRANQRMQNLKMAVIGRAAVALTALREQGPVGLQPLGPVPRVDLGGADGGLLDRLPGTGTVRELVRQVGIPLRLPMVPLPPVLPPVTLGAWRLRLPWVP